MDFWLVAAVAGAGYLSKYWQNLSRNTRLSQLLSSGDSDSNKPQSLGCPLRVLTNRPKAQPNVHSDNITSFDDAVNTENHQDLVELLVSNLQSGFLGSEEFESLNSLPSSLSVEEMGSSTNGCTRNRSSVRTKVWSHGLSVKPMNSLESCLMAQLHKEHNETQEYVLSSSRRESFSSQIGIEEERESCIENDESVFGVPCLRANGSMNLSVKPNYKKQNELNEKETNLKGFDPRDGNGKFLLCLGISIGIMSSFMTSKREVDELKDALKQTETLVQDLHEELEMKDSMTVKELANDNYVAQDININGSDSCLQRGDESSECISKIEAELEAELERLGLNMNASTLERQSSHVVELDPDLAVDFARGELRVDTLGLEDLSKSKSNDGDGASTSTTRETANYAVSPRELSLRLHKVIQSRLEERVNELEVALQNSQRKMKLMQSGGKNWGELRYLRTQESPVTKEHNSPHEELVKTSDSEEEDSPRRIYEDIHSSALSLQGVFQSQGIETPEEKSLGELFPGCLRARDEDISLVLGSNDTSISRDEISDCENEIERELIKQIVERTKKGSDVVVNAQRLLFSMEEKEI